MQIQNSIGFSLFLFGMSALALVLTGTLVTDVSVNEIILLSTIGVLGTFWVYAFNLFKFIHKPNLKGVILLITTIIATIIGISYDVFSLHRIFVISLIFLLGITYSIPIKTSNKSYQIKAIPVVKNIFIGIAWGLLILFGASDAKSDVAVGLCLFSVIQITVGSTVRDAYDLEKDRIKGIVSIPMLLTPIWLRGSLHFFNLLSVLIPILMISNKIVWFCMIFAAFMRGIVIEKSYLNHQYFWTQPVNILSTWFLLIGLILFYK